MTGSNLALSVLMDHAGVIRRSDEELSETTRSGTSAISCGGTLVYSVVLDGVCQQASAVAACTGRGGES